MPSSLFGKAAQGPAPAGGGNILQQFAQFKRQMAGKDPKAIIDQLLAEGKMTPQQLETLKKQAATYMSILR